MSIRLLFNVSAAVEALVGVALMLSPALVVGLLLGEGPGPTGTAVARVAGIALLSLGVAAWQGRQEAPHHAPRAGICLYNVGVAALLMMVGTFGGISGPLLWPVAALHGLVGVAMLWTILA